MGIPFILHTETEGKNDIEVKRVNRKKPSYALELHSLSHSEK